MGGSPLYGGVKALLTCDSGDVVSGIVDFVIAQNRALRLLSGAMRRAGGTPIASAIILINALRCYLGIRLTGDGDVVTIARRPNERRAIEHFTRMADGYRFAELAIEWEPRSMWRTFVGRARYFLRDCVRLRRLARLLCRRYGVFRALRACELVACYTRYLELLDGSSLRAAVLSTHSNPHGIALNLAARRLGTSVVLITHGMPIRPLARLHYDLAIYESVASRRIYDDAGCRMRWTVIKSRRCDYAPMQLPEPAAPATVGIFLSKDPIEGQVMQCLRALMTDYRIVRIVVRPHPVNLWRDLAARVESLRDARVLLQRRTALADDLAMCDVVVGGNSTVLLDAVVAGRPACYVSGLDHGPHDVQDFVKDRLVYEWPAPSRLDFLALEQFYLRRDWPRVLRAYADVDRTDEDVIAAVQAALAAMIDRRVGAVA
jgi:hypothetical protein